METFVTKKSFNPELEGKAVRFKGYDENGEHPAYVYLVQCSDGDEFQIVNHVGHTKYFDINDFTHEENPLQLIVLEDSKCNES